MHGHYPQHIVDNGQELDDVAQQLLADAFTCALATVSKSSFLALDSRSNACWGHTRLPVHGAVLCPCLATRFEGDRKAGGMCVRLTCAVYGDLHVGACEDECGHKKTHRDRLAEPARRGYSVGLHAVMHDYYETPPLRNTC